MWKWIQLWDACNGSLLLQGRRRLNRDSLDGLWSSTSARSSGLISSHVSVYASSALPILKFIKFPWLYASLWDNFMSSWKFLLSLVCLPNFWSSRSGLHCLALFPVIAALTLLLYYSTYTLCSGLRDSGLLHGAVLSCLSLYLSPLNTTGSIQKIVTECWLGTKHCTVRW